MIGILIVDDHAVVRQGLRFLLEQQPDINVVGECGDGEQAVALASSLLPDIILLDLLMPKMDAMTAVREIKRITPVTQIIILTSYYEDDQIFGVIKAGASPICSKIAVPTNSSPPCEPQRVVKARCTRWLPPKSYARCNNNRPSTISRHASATD